MNREEYFYKHPKDNTLSTLSALIMKYGGDMSIRQVMEAYKSELDHKRGKFICPKCNGKGYIVKEYNAYPGGLPDSGWVYKPGYDYNECDLCNGVGYTNKEYKAKTETKIIGYEEVK